MEQDGGFGQGWDGKVLSPILCGEFKFVGKDFHLAVAQNLCEIRRQETTFNVGVSSQICEGPFILETLDGCNIFVLMHQRSQVAGILCVQRQSAEQQQAQKV
jgi:hypothetical protein